MPKTINGIYNNIFESNYRIEMNGLIFYFSSIFYLEKFKNNVKSFIEEEKLKLYNRYKVILMCDTFLAISYYKKLEKRGFYITDKENNRISSNIVYTFTELKV